jgi:hypothetical protein
MESERLQTNLPERGGIGFDKPSNLNPVGSHEAPSVVLLPLSLCKKKGPNPFRIFSPSLPHSDLVC